MPSGVQLRQPDRAAGRGSTRTSSSATCLVMRREHHADRRDHDVERLVARTAGSRRRPRPSRAARRRPPPARGPASSSSGVRSVAATLAPAQGRRERRVAGAGGNVEDARARPDPARLHQPRPERQQQGLHHRGVVAGCPHRAVARLQLCVRRRLPGGLCGSIVLLRLGVPPTLTARRHPAHREVPPIFGRRASPTLGSAVELLERDGEQEVLEAAIEESRAAGRVVVVLGEAGIGKTALVASVCAGARRAPRALGRLRPADHAAPARPAARRRARQVGGAMAAAIDAGSARGRARRRARRARRGGASVLVVEDLHWADDATLDLVALLGRRLVRARGCLVLTCRSDALDERPEVRRVLGALPARVPCGGSSRAAARRDAVALLAAARGRDAVRPARRSPAATRSSSPRCSPRRPTAACPRACAMPSRCASRASAAGRGPSSSWPRSSPARPSCGCCRRDRRRRDDHHRRVRRRGPAQRAGRGARVPPRPRAARGRGRHLADPPARARPPRAGTRWRPRGDADPARLAHHARRTGDVAAIRRHVPAAARAAPRRARSPAGARALGGRAAARRGPRRRRGARGRCRRGVPVRVLERALGGAPRAARDPRGGRRRRCTPATTCAGCRASLWWTGPRRRGARGRRPGHRRARGVPGQPRAGDGAQRPSRSSRCSPSRTREAIALGHARGRCSPAASATPRRSPTR